jgi:GTPase SAR1 family protein
VSISYEVGRGRIQELVASAPSPERLRNEAETRLQVIDRLLFDCLGWSLESAAVEHHQTGEYADYLLDRKSRLLVVEAKREGRDFHLQEDLSRITELKALIDLGGEVAAALEQALRYGQERGCPYGAVSNGHQLIAFRASRGDGVSPRHGRAVVFESLASMVEDFSTLWDAVSQQACASRRLTRILAGNSATPTPPRLSEQIPNFPGSAKPTEGQLVLSTVDVLFLPDFVRDDEDEKEFLAECYAPPGAYSRLASLSKGVLQTRYSEALGAELNVALKEAHRKSGVNQELLDEIAITSSGREPLVLLGDVGVGKTMFLRRLLRIDMKEVAESSIVLYINLGRNAILEDVRSHIASSLPDQLYDRYQVDINSDSFLRGTYQHELVRFGDGVNAKLAEIDPPEFERRQIDYLRGLSERAETHIGRSLRHLVSLRKQQIVIVLDNIDQRERTDQEQTFLAAQAMAKNWPCTVFLTLRPETFNASRIDGVLSGYQTRAFTVSPPRVERAVKKRLEFGAQHYVRHGHLPEWLGWTAHSDELQDYLQILLKSFSRNERLQETLVNLAGGNVRRALELMSTFVNSPHSEHETVLKRSRQSKRDFLIPHHLFLRAVLLGDAAYYDASRSHLPNVFDISGHDAREHFLLLCMLGFLHSNLDRRDSEGYVAVEDLYARFQDLGFEPDQIGFALSRARSGDLVQTLPPGADVRALRLTMIGNYAYSALSSEFPYLDAVLVETPVIDPDVREKLRLVTATRPKLERAELFISYLTSAWEEADLAETGFYEWASAHSRLIGEIELIRSRL